MRELELTCMERLEEYFTIPNFDTVAVASSQTCSTSKRKKKKSNNMNKRRFSDEQIRSLESIFCSWDSKLDSRKKVQLATELGLQPRQIAIWFQNRRARCKSKQMENDFRSLRANYDNLASQFLTLQEENNTLLSQCQKLSELVQEGPREGYYSDDIGKTTYESQARTKILQGELEKNGVKKWAENEEVDRGLQVTQLLEGRSNHISHTEEQVCQFLNSNGSYESSKNWCGFDSDGGVIFDYQSSSSLEGPSFWG